MNTLRKVFSADLRSLALFRVGLGVLILADLFIRSRFLEAHYTDFGVLPLSVIFEKLNFPQYFSVHYMNGHYPFQVILFVIQALLAVSLLLGYRTRLVTVLSWYMMISLNMRNSQVLQGGDVLLRMLLFWAIFLPTNLRFSLDLVYCKPEFRKKAYEQSSHFSVASFAVMAQVFVLYFSTAVLKMHESWVSKGTALHYVMHLESFLTPFGLWFAQFSHLFKPLTQGVWLWEMFGPCLLYTSDAADE